MSDTPLPPLHPEEIDPSDGPECNDELLTQDEADALRSEVAAYKRTLRRVDPAKTPIWPSPSRGGTR